MGDGALQFADIVGNLPVVKQPIASDQDLVASD
jgi:hypothetical protein